MEKKNILEALKLVREKSPKRKFVQTLDLVVTLKDYDLKKQENQIDAFVALSNPVKVKKVGAFVAAELKPQATKLCSTVVDIESFPKYENNKKMIKKLADDVDFFIAQVTIMPAIAKVFGRILGPKGKMPNPKAGAVLPPAANIAPVVERLGKTSRIVANKQAVLKCAVGREDMDDDKIADNVLMIFNAVSGKIEDRHLKNVILKFTMGPPVKVKK